MNTFLLKLKLSEALMILAGVGVLATFWWMPEATLFWVAAKGLYLLGVVLMLIKM